MTGRALLVAVVLIARTAAGQQPPPAVTIIHARSALDGRGGVIDNPYIIVRGTTIERIAT